MKTFSPETSHRTVLGAVVAGVAAALALPVGTAAAPTEPAANGRELPVGRLAWAPCYQEMASETGVSYECSTANVPLDHDDPAGTQIQLALLRVPAADPAGRLGSILVNPGGPGGSGVDFVLLFAPWAAEVLGRDVVERFDLVGFDPRGVQRSRPLRCFGNEQQAMTSLAPFAFPITDDEIEAWIAGDTLLAEQCDRRGGAVGPHMSTANVARDMDLLRDALGDEQLTYFAGSYGSYLGLTYANLFPDNVRAIAVDGVVDPEAWANVEGRIPLSTRLRSDHGAQATLDRFLQLCEEAGPTACAMAPDAAARFDALAERLRSDPVEFLNPITGTLEVLTYQRLIGNTLSTLYDPFSFAFGAELFRVVEQAAADGDPVTVEDPAVRAGLVQRGFPHYPNNREAFAGVQCTDSTNPSDYATWAEAAAGADEEYGYFGRLWTWNSSACAQWPWSDEDRYVGPFDSPTANPVLLVGNLYDPATRYEGAVAARALLPDSALVTVDLAGHTALGASACATRIVGRYLLDPSTARAVDGTVCRQEFNPFELAAGNTAPDARGLAPALRARLASEGGPFG